MYADRLWETKVRLPGLLGGMTYEQIRQLIALLRAGKIGSGDLRISPQVMADVLEQTIDDEALVKWSVATLDQEHLHYERWSNVFLRWEICGPTCSRTAAHTSCIA